MKPQRPPRPCPPRPADGSSPGEEACLPRGEDLRSGPRGSGQETGAGERPPRPFTAYLNTNTPYGLCVDGSASVPVPVQRPDASKRGRQRLQAPGLELYLDRSSAGSSSRCSGWTRGGVGGGYREGQSKIRVLLPCSRPKRRWHRPLLPPKEGERPRRTVGAGGGKERNKLSPVRESVGCSTSQWDPPPQVRSLQLRLDFFPSSKHTPSSSLRARPPPSRCLGLGAGSQIFSAR